MSDTHQLKRGLKNRHVQLLAIGGAIGTGLFLGSGRAIHLAGPSIIFAYLITGVMCFFIMRALGELLLSNLNHHSFIDFVEDYLGDRAAFITGWTYWFCWLSLAMADLTAVGLYMQYWIPWLPQWIPALLVLVALLLMNLTAVKYFGEMEFWFALIKVIAIISLIIIGIIMIVTGFTTDAGVAAFSNMWNYGGWFPNGTMGFILSFQMVVFAFTGIELVGLTAGETEDPEKVIPMAINNIPLRIILFYVGSLAIIMSIYPWTAVNPAASPFVAVFTAEPVEATLFVLLPLSPIKRLINPYAPIIPAAIIVTTTTATRPLFSFLLFLLYAFLLFLYELPLIPTSFQITFYLQQLSTFSTQQNEYKFVNINCQAYFT